MSKESGEIWKDVPGYEGLYKVSTFNNVNPWGYKHCKHCGQKLDWSEEE